MPCTIGTIDGGGFLLWGRGKKTFFLFPLLRCQTAAEMILDPFHQGANAHIASFFFLIPPLFKTTSPNISLLRERFPLLPLPYSDLYLNSADLDPS